MLRIKGKAPELIRVGRKAAALIYAGGKLAWEGVRSCFGSGVWRDDKPWRDDDAWK